MACITALEENTTKNVWEGVSVRTGETKVFQTLDDYKRYTDSLETKGIYCPDIEPKHNIHYTKGANTVPTGFLEFRPRDAKTQSKYDAMQSTWEGVESSEKAVARGDYSLDAAETTKRELRSPTPTMPKSKVREDYCCLQ
jgi:hypothetical protein